MLTDVTDRMTSNSANTFSRLLESVLTIQSSGRMFGCLHKSCVHVCVCMCACLLQTNECCISDSKCLGGVLIGLRPAIIGNSRKQKELRISTWL